jgi:hypothetical protein
MNSSLSTIKKLESAALRRELEAKIQEKEEHQENQGDPFIREEYDASDIDWLRHNGKLLGVIPWSFKERWLMFLYRIKKWFKNLFSNI